ncbi:hypothetical protein HFO88_33485 [Rhizobium leguminosarum]|jgi:hypothetical protein|uniref:hypothetical protein n=1 Tax=Rhizobium leguminosarum TaxID=384 RepID=UPI001C952258|nr:hypothetical protein [Rhizobium leguminosarum]MBY5905178.1 hypothetical protein [Rhizobium leguminosarum]MBY5912253.1 hypothetical protein [Rhizobium leguminosarum]
MDADIWNGAFYDDGEWVSWSDVEEQLQYQEWRAKYPNVIRHLIPYFQDLLALAESYHRETGRHLDVYGVIGELFGAITYGIKLNKNYAQGADGRLGNDHVEIKTITPFKSKDEVSVKVSSNFSKLLVVKINGDFEVSSRMVDRSKLPKTTKPLLRIRWSDLPKGQ